MDSGFFDPIKLGMISAAAHISNCKHWKKSDYRGKHSLTFKVLSGKGFLKLIQGFKDLGLKAYLHRKQPFRDVLKSRY